MATGSGIPVVPRNEIGYCYQLVMLLFSALAHSILGISSSFYIKISISSMRTHDLIMSCNFIHCGFPPPPLSLSLSLQFHHQTLPNLRSRPAQLTASPPLWPASLAPSRNPPISPSKTSTSRPTTVTRTLP